MSPSSRLPDRAGARAPGRLADGLASLAWVLLAAMPLAMAIANRSSTLMVALAAAAAIASRVAGREPAIAMERARDDLRRPLVLAGLAFLLLAAVSLAWSHHPGRSLSLYGELVLAALAPFLLHLALPGRVPDRVWVLAAVLVAAGALWIAAELAMGVSLRAGLGFRSQTYIFKRSATAILIVFWPVAAWLWLDGRRGVAIVVGGLVLVAILWAHAAAAAMGFMAGLTLLLVARESRRAATGLLAAALAISLLLAPVFGTLAARTLGERTLDALHDMQARDRVLIWESFGEVIRLRPWTGTGFGTSSELGRDPVAAEVPESRRLMLAVGHPHNGYVQVWTELGLPGAALAGLVLGLLCAGIARLPGPGAAAALAVAGSAGAIMLVAHGAWQGWWITALGAAAIWLLRLPAPRDPARPRP